MIIEFKKQVEVTETFEINLPAWYAKVETYLPYAEYMKVISETEYLSFVLYTDGDFHFTRRTGDATEIHKFALRGKPITEEEFLIATRELQVRLFMAAETHTDEVKTFEEILT